MQKLTLNDLNAMLLEGGDFVGHPFRGNQYAGGNAEAYSKVAMRESRLAHTAAEHEHAAHIHARAAELHRADENNDVAKQHEKMARGHAAKAAELRKSEK